MLLVLKLCTIQVVISFPLWIKLTMGQLLLFFLCNFSSSFSYVGGIPVTNHFSLLLIDRYSYILAIQQIRTHKRSICDSLFDLLRSSELPQKPWHHGHSNRKWLKQPQSHFYWAVPSKSRIFRCFDVCSVLPPQKFKVQAKISTVRPVSPDYLSVSYDCALTDSIKCFLIPDFNNIILICKSSHYIKCSKKQVWKFSHIERVHSRKFVPRSQIPQGVWPREIVL